VSRTLRTSTFEELHFVQHRMSMSHIYQLLLIRSLVEAGGLPHFDNWRIRRTGRVRFSSTNSASSRCQLRFSSNMAYPTRRPAQTLDHRTALPK